MDQVIKDSLARMVKQNNTLKRVEHMFNELDGSEKSLFSQLLLSASGTSLGEREAKAYASQEWRDFAKGLAQAKSELNYEKRKYSILENAYFAVLAEYKREHALIKRGAE